MDINDLINLAKNNKSEAILKYMENNNVGIAEAKEQIEKLLSDNIDTIQLTNDETQLNKSIEKKDNKKSKHLYIIVIVMICSVLVLIICAITAGKSDNIESETNTTITPTTENIETTSFEKYYPTVDEYYQQLTKGIILPIEVEEHNADSCVYLSWSTQYINNIDYTYVTTLYLDNNDRIKSCETHLIKDKFYNQFCDLFSNRTKYEVFVNVSYPEYLLACFHSGSSFDNDEYSGIINESFISSLSNNKNYSTSFFDCDYSVNMYDYGIFSYLDYGDNYESDEQTNSNINSILENNSEAFIVCNTMSTTSGTKTVEVYGLFLNDANNIQTKNYTLKYNNDEFIIDSSLVADGTSFKLIEEEGIVKLASVLHTDNYTMLDTTYLDLICDENNRIIGFKVEGGEQFDELASKKMINDCLSLE